MRHVRSWSLVLLASAVLLAARPAGAVEPRVAECLSSSERAESLRRDGRYREARKAFAACGADSCPAVVRRDCIASLTDLDRLEPTFVFAARDENGNDVANVTVTIDGELVTQELDGKPIGLDAGKHLVSFAAGPLYREERVSIVARTGEKNRIVSIQLTPVQPSPPPERTPDGPVEPPPTEPLPVVPIVLAGVGVVAIGAFAYLGLSAKSDLSALESDACAATKTCAQDDVDSIRTRFTLADVSLGVGAVAIGAAAWLFFTRDRTTSASLGRFRPPTHRPVDVRATSHGVSVTLERRF